MADIGLTGLGTMGQALALNIAEKGYGVAAHNRSPGRVDDLMERARREGQDARVTPCRELSEMVAALSAPRAVIVMVQAGGPVDAVIEDLVPLLEKGDTIIDAGNADFNDTRRREADLKARGILFVGMGVSGGEEGARTGPAIMVGGPEESYAPIRELIEAISAKYRGEPCAARLGPDGAGHFVKTVHNGIEYADMQMIADIYGILRDGAGMSAPEIAPVFARWNEGELESYLVEITAKVLAAADRDEDVPAVDAIEDTAGQKGTGRWTLIEALKLGQSASTIEAAVAARSWSAAKAFRLAASEAFDLPDAEACEPDLEALEAALLTAKIIAYDQGLALLGSASDHFEWDIDLAQVAEVWRAGCIIRSALLPKIAQSARAGLPHGSLILSDAFLPVVRSGLPALRETVCAASRQGLPVPALSAALQYLETLRRGRGTANLIQAQRDFFGRHGFTRNDGRAHMHGPWWDDEGGSAEATGQPE